MSCLLLLLVLMIFFCLGVFCGKALWYLHTFQSMSLKWLFWNLKELHLFVPVSHYHFLWGPHQANRKTNSALHLLNLFYLSHWASSPLDFFSYQKQQRKCSIKRNVLKNFTKFAGKHLYQEIPVSPFQYGCRLRSAILLKKRFWKRCFPVNFQLTHLLKNRYYSQFAFFVHMHIIVIIRVNSWNDHNSQQVLTND